MINPSKNLRAGDECYTPIDTIVKLQKHYDLHNKNIWLPFCVETSPFYLQLKKDNNVILSPEHTKTYVSEQLSLFDVSNQHKFKKTNADYYYDFDKAIRDKTFIKHVIDGKYIIFDNPPFEGLTKKLIKLLPFNIPFFLFKEGMTITSTYYTLRKSSYELGFDFIGDVYMENANLKKKVLIVLLTNTHTKMQSVWINHKKSEKPLKRPIPLNQLNAGLIYQLLRRGVVLDKKDYECYLKDRNLFGGYWLTLKGNRNKEKDLYGI